jgi:hypothetical protein
MAQEYGTYQTSTGTTYTGYVTVRDDGTRVTPGGQEVKPINK